MKAPPVLAKKKHVLLQVNRSDLRTKDESSSTKKKIDGRRHGCRKAWRGVAILDGESDRVLKKTYRRDVKQSGTKKTFSIKKQGNQKIPVQTTRSRRV